MFHQTTAAILPRICSIFRTPFDRSSVAGQWNRALQRVVGSMYNGHLYNVICTMDTCTTDFWKNDIYTIGQLYNRTDEKKRTVVQWILVQSDTCTIGHLYNGKLNNGHMYTRTVVQRTFVQWTHYSCTVVQSCRARCFRTEGSQSQIILASLAGDAGDVARFNILAYSNDLSWVATLFCRILSSSNKSSRNHKVQGTGIVWEWKQFRELGLLRIGVPHRKSWFPNPDALFVGHPGGNADTYYRTDPGTVG